MSEHEIKGRSLQELLQLLEVQDLGFLGVAPLTCCNRSSAYPSEHGVKYHDVVEFTDSHIGYEIARKSNRLRQGVYLVELYENCNWECEPIEDLEPFDAKNLLFLGVDLAGRFCPQMSTFKYKGHSVKIKAFDPGLPTNALIHIC